MPTAPLRMGVIRMHAMAPPAPPELPCGDGTFMWVPGFPDWEVFRRRADDSSTVFVADMSAVQMGQLELKRNAVTGRWLLQGLSKMWTAAADFTDVQEIGPLSTATPHIGNPKFQKYVNFDRPGDYVYFSSQGDQNGDSTADADSIWRKTWAGASATEILRLSWSPQYVVGFPNWVITDAFITSTGDLLYRVPDLSTIDPAHRGWWVKPIVGPFPMTDPGTRINSTDHVSGGGHACMSADGTTVAFRSSASVLVFMDAATGATSSVASPPAYLPQFWRHDNRSVYMRIVSSAQRGVFDRYTGNFCVLSDDAATARQAWSHIEI